MARRVSPSERVRAQIDELFAGDRDLAVVLEEVARLSVRLVMQSAVEAEVTEFLGRLPHERREDGDPAGSRNGWHPPVAIKTTTPGAWQERAEAKVEDAGGERGQRHRPSPPAVTGL